MTTLHADESAVPGIAEWRAQLVRRILRILLIAGGIVVGPSVVMAVITEQWAIAVVDVLAISAIAWLSSATVMRDRTRALGVVVIPFIVGVWLLPTVQPAGQVYLIAVPVLAALLLGRRAALIALTANAGALVLAGVITGFDAFPLTTTGGSLANWAVTSLNLLFINGVMALSCAVLLERLEQSLAKERTATAALAVRGADLEVANQDLAREMAERQRAEVHLRTADKLQALATLASGTAHDFNNVLGSILAVAERARGRTDDAHMVGDLDAIIGACDRARGVVRQLVAFGGPVDAGRRAVRLDDVVATALPLLQAALPAGVELVDDLRAQGWITAGPSEIEQVLTNLVTNAAQAAAGGPRTTITVTVVDAPAQTEAAPAAVLLSVSDQGPGISEEHLHKIFDPFFTTRLPGEGAGLGLASVHGIVASLGGMVEVDTTVGRGTTFRVRIPALPDPPTGSGPSPGPIVDAMDVTPSGRILLVDDEELILTLAARALRAAGHDVVTAGDGNEAQRLFRTAPTEIDVLITDMSMPGLDGAALIRSVRAIRPELPVIVCSGHVFASTDGRSDGTVDHLPKPYTTAELNGCVSRAMGRLPSR